MSWARLDDRYPRHRKLVAAGVLRPLCIALDVSGICHAAEYATDGFVADRDLPHVLEVLPRNRQQAVLAKLVDVGRWHRDTQAGGYWIHDFLKYNPSAAKRLAEADAAEARKEADRERKAAARRAKPGSRKGNDEQKTTKRSPRESPDRTAADDAADAAGVTFPQVASMSGRNPRGQTPDSPRTRPQGVRSSPVPKDGTAQKAGSPVPPRPPDVPADIRPDTSPVHRQAAGDVPATPDPDPSLAATNGRPCRHRNDPATCGICSPAVGTRPPTAALDQVLGRVRDTAADEPPPDETASGSEQKASRK
jgi:hypothetical protein